ncbi:hypothetical protein U1Q18_052318 [Sarracenia purpurea var. burkii]
MKLVGVARGLKHIHEQSIVHGDLKAVRDVIRRLLTLLANPHAVECPRGCGRKMARICDFGSSIINCSCYDAQETKKVPLRGTAPNLWRRIGLEQLNQMSGRLVALRSR